MMLPIVETEIDEDVLIKCPVKDFAYRKASIVCPQCAGFMGVAKIGEEGNWPQKYVIRCAAMIERRTMIIEVVD